VRSLRYFTLAALLLSAGAARAADESPYKFEFHGFATGSLYMQNQAFNGGGGQGLLLTAPAPFNNAPCKAYGTNACTPNGTTVATKSGTFIGGDVRQSRFVFALSGPPVWAGATPKAYFEGDLGGGAAASPLVESWIWRIRAVYAELKWTNFTLQAGQHSAQLAFAMLPDTVAHIANPYTFGAGNIGFRTMGLRGFYTVPLGAMKFELAGSVAQPTAPDNNAPGAAVNTISSGMATNMPQVEARARIEGKSGPLGFNIYADGLYNTVDLKGYGTTRPNGIQLADGSFKKSMNVQAVELGGKLSFTPVFVAFNAYTGQGTGSIAGALLQQGEIQDTEFWVQAGVNLTKEFSVNATYGLAKLDETDVRKWAGFPSANAAPFANPAAAGGPIPKKENQLMAAQAKYLDGGYVFAVEYISYETTFLQGSLTAKGPNVKTDAYQIIGTFGYFF
jgi:hypothetical protein